MPEKKLYNPGSTGILKGISIIEASAGTGKTFAISMLVLRAVVEMELKLEQILVVTFTVAATEELRDRIRNRLNQGLDLLSGEKRKGVDYDEVITGWAAQIKDKSRAEELLRQALIDIDRAPIFTIHGFCQRMLTEQALESGQLFEIELTGDAGLIRAEMVRDFWRTHIYNLDIRYCRLLTERYPGPDQLFRSTLGGDSLLAELVPEPLGIREGCNRLERAWERFGRWWHLFGEELQQQLQLADEENLLNKELSLSYRDLSAELDRCTSDNELPGPQAVSWLLPEKLLQGLSGSKLRGPKKQEYLESLTIPTEASLFLGSVETFIREVRLALALKIRGELSRKLRMQGLMSFDDLVQAVAEKIDGDDGRELTRLIGKRYLMALIDEFQDTDGAQWKIFNTIFGTGRHFLYLIGDPKQAIYRFRGADIHSYFEARKRADRSLTLNFNFRSHPELVHAVNTIFSGSEIAGERYSAVQPACSAADGRIRKDGVEKHAMLICRLDQNPGKKQQWSSGAAAERIMIWVAAEICRLLDGREGYSIEAESGSEKLRRRVEPFDIAILVRSNVQAELYHQMLSSVGVPSVVASRVNVFSTRECREMIRVLHAVTRPGDSGALKAVLGSEWFGLSGQDFWGIISDEQEFNRKIECFRNYFEIWMEHGFLTMFTTLVRDEGVYINLCSKENAEREIANVQHLSEMIQEAEQAHRYGPLQTLEWLGRMYAGQLEMEETELRLESDSRSVKIVTMHSAKGLEFPVVFCPYLMLGPRPSREEKTVALCHRDDRLIVDLGSEEFEMNRDLERREEWEEDLRLVYVALTRARLRCYLFWCDIAGVGKYPSSLESPLATLLFEGSDPDFDQQQDCLQALWRKKAADFCLIEPEVGDEQLSYRKEFDPDIRLREREKGTRSLRTARLLTSFSGLASSLFHHEEELPGAFDEQIYDSVFLEISRLPAASGLVILSTTPWNSLIFRNLRTSVVRISCRDFAPDTGWRWIRMCSGCFLRTVLPLL